MGAPSSPRRGDIAIIIDTACTCESGKRRTGGDAEEEDKCAVFSKMRVNVMKKIELYAENFFLA